MNELKIFQSEEFGEVRTVTIDGEPCFVGKDVAEALGYSETNSMTKRLDKEDFISAKLSGMNMKSTVINESGLYNAIFGSKLEACRRTLSLSSILPKNARTAFGGNYGINCILQHPYTVSHGKRKRASAAAFAYEN